MSEHTPGPWYIYDDEIRATEAWYEKVCTMPSWGPYDDGDLSSRIEAETNANACLIAAAPDMAARIEELEKQNRELARCLDGAMYAMWYMNKHDLEGDLIDWEERYQLAKAALAATEDDK